MGAGCIIQKDDEFLALVTREGKFDLPKGHADLTDMNTFVTAQRETWEECGIWVTEDQVLDQFTMLKMTLYVVEWDGTPPDLRPNPHSGELEHSGWVWLTPNEFKKNCLGYLEAYIEEYQAIMFL